MRITIEPTRADTPPHYPRVSVEVPTDDMSIDQVIEWLVQPALLGCGYAQTLVDSIRYGADVPDA
jgi:hypothetical protein